MDEKTYPKFSFDAAKVIIYGGGGLSKMFGGEGSIYRSRRGVEKTIFNLTIGLTIVFVLVSVTSVLVAG